MRNIHQNLTTNEVVNKCQLSIGLLKHLTYAFTASLYTNNVYIVCSQIFVYDENDLTFTPNNQICQLLNIDQNNTHW